MTLGLTAFFERRSNVGLAFTCILILSATPLYAIQMARIAQFNEALGGNFPCGDARHNGRFAVWGTISDSVVGYEYESDNLFQRIVTGGLTFEGVWAFGDGDGDSLMELVGLGQSGPSVVIFESRTDTSYPIDSVWRARLSGASYPYPKYMDLDRDGHQEIAVAVDGSVWLYENTGDNQYERAAILTDTAPFGGPEGDFDVGDLERDGLMDLVVGGVGNWLFVYKATGQNNQYVLTRCSTETRQNYNVAVAHDMDQNGWPEFIAFGQGDAGVELMIYEAVAGGGYHRVWEQSRYDWYQDWFGNPISVGDIDGDKTEEFAVHTGGGVALFKCIGPHDYTEVWSRDSVGTFERLFDINGDGRVELFFNGPHGTEVWEDTEGLAVAEFSKFSLESPVKVLPSVVRLGASLLFSGVPAAADIEVLSLDGRLVTRTHGVRQSTWTWDLRDQSGNLVPAGTYFAVVRSKGKSTSLKLCLVK